jgi:hypothetical protein
MTDYTTLTDDDLYDTIKDLWVQIAIAQGADPSDLFVSYDNDTPAGQAYNAACTEWLRRFHPALVRESK